jgi:epoxyqueuosine reductase QueG
MGIVYERLKEFALSSGATFFGTGYIEDLRSYFDNLSLDETDGLSWGISIGIRLSNPVLKGIIDHPTRLYLHHYKNINYLLDQISIKLSLYIQEEGYQALPIPASQIVDWEKQVAHLSHKMIALRAGIGWLGKNNLIVHPEYGAKIRLSTILTDLPLRESEDIEEGCGNCRKCVDICPAGALKNSYKDYNMLACLNKLKHFSKTYNIGQYICGLCVKVCNGFN